MRYNFLFSFKLHLLLFCCCCHAFSLLLYYIWFDILDFFSGFYLCNTESMYVMVLEGMREKKSFGIFVCKPQLLWFCCRGFLGSCMGYLLQRYTTLWQSSLKTTWFVLTDSIAAIGAILYLRNIFGGIWLRINNGALWSTISMIQID